MILPLSPDKFFKLLLCVILSIQGAACGSAQVENSVEKDVLDRDDLLPRLAMVTEADPETGSRISRGSFAVFENRVNRSGRVIHLDVVVLHAFQSPPRPDPMFFLAGGPGADVSQSTDAYRHSWIRQARDIVLVSQRGTGGDNRLDCALAANDNDIQGYLDPLFDTRAFRTCLQELEKDFDLTQYSTSWAADDLNEVRVALGYDRINLSGTSYGTRMALIYMRRHPHTVRTAILNGVIPLANKNPLHHAPSGQYALDLLFADCRDDPDCRRAYPDLEEEFRDVLKRLEDGPVETTVTHPVTGARVPVKLSRAAFAEALRTMMYYMRYNIQVPYLIHRAYQGDFRTFAQYGMESNRGIRKALALGMLLCVTCAEDIARIEPGEIEKITGNSFLGENRIREQAAVCEFWPKSPVPGSYGDPVSVDVPVLLLSGTRDPVTPPYWGEEAARHLPNGFHLAVPGTHGVGGDCVRAIQEQFLETGSVRDLDIDCAAGMTMARFRTPGG